MNKLTTHYLQNGQKPQDNRVFWAQTAVFALLLINALTGNVIPGMLILGVAMILPFFLRPVDIAAYIVGFSVMGTGIQVAYIALACLAAVLLKSRLKIRTVTLVAILAFSFYELLQLSLSPKDEIVEFIRYLAVYLLLFYVLFMDYGVQEKLRIVDGYVYGVIVCVVHIFIEMFRVLKGDLTLFVDGTYRFGYAEQLQTDLTMSADPNLVGQGCSFVIVFCLALIMLGYKNKKYYAALFIALLVGTLTISKTFLLSLALIALFLFLFMGPWSSAKMLRNRLLLVALVVVGVIVVMQVNPTYMDNILARVDEADITTGRVDNALIYLEYLSHDIGDLLFGVGMQNVGEKIGFTGSPHAAMVEMLICWGVVGTLLMLALIVKAILQHTADYKPKAVHFVPLVIFVILTQSTQFFRLRDRVFALIVVVVLMGIPQKGVGQLGNQKDRIAGG